MVLQYEVFIVYRPTKQKLQQAEWPTKYIDYRRICAKLTNYELIWLLLVSSTFAQMHSEVGHFFVNLTKSAAQLTKCTHIWPNVAHLVKFLRCCQLVRCAAHLGKCAHWSNAPYNEEFLDGRVAAGLYN